MTETTFCSFCDTHAIGHVPSPVGPWSYCANHEHAARSEARYQTEQAR